MLRCYDFKCAEHGTFEILLSERPDVHPCPKCGADSPRQFSAPQCVNPKYVVACGDVRRKYVGRT